MISKEDLFEFLENDLMIEIEEIDENTSLFSEGFVDSFSLLELIAFIEIKIEAKLNQDDVTLENFDSITRILDFLASRTDEG